MLVRSLYLQLRFAMRGLRQFRQRLREALFELDEPLHGFGIRFSGLGERHVGSDHHPDLLAHMVEGQHLVEEEQAGVGNAQLVLGVAREPLDLADGVVGKKADGAGGEGRQACEACGLVAAQRLAQHVEDVAFDVGGPSGLQ